MILPLLFESQGDTSSVEPYTETMQSEYEYAVNNCQSLHSRRNFLYFLHNPRLHLDYSVLYHGMSRLRSEESHRLYHHLVSYPYSPQDLLYPFWMVLDWKGETLSSHFSSYYQGLLGSKPNIKVLKQYVKQ